VVEVFWVHGCLKRILRKCIRFLIILNQYFEFVFVLNWYSVIADNVNYLIAKFQYN
jgi:hypothetical protein